MGSIVDNEHAASFKWSRETEPENAVDDFDFNLSLLIHTIKKHAAMKRPCRWSKPWWTPELTQLRKDFTCATRKAKMNPTLTQDAKAKKKTYRLMLTGQKQLTGGLSSKMRRRMMSGWHINSQRKDQVL